LGKHKSPAEVQKIARFVARS